MLLLKLRLEHSILTMTIHSTRSGRLTKKRSRSVSEARRGPVCRHTKPATANYLTYPLLVLNSLLFSLLQVGSLLHSTKTERCQITTVTLAGSTRQAMRHSPTATHLRATSQRRTFLSVAPTIFCRGLELWYKSMALIGSNLISRAS